MTESENDKLIDSFEEDNEDTLEDLGGLLDSIFQELDLAFVNYAKDKGIEDDDDIRSAFYELWERFAGM